MERIGEEMGTIRGFVRHVDELGRIVIPIDIRREFLLTADATVEVYVEGSKVILEKFKYSDGLKGNLRELRYALRNCHMELKQEDISRIIGYLEEAESALVEALANNTGGKDNG